MANDITLKLVVLIAGVVTIGVGVLMLDWVTYDVSVTGPFGDALSGANGTGIDIDEGKISLIAGAVSGLIGLLGVNPSVSRPVVGLGVVLGAVIVTGATVYFLANVEDESFVVPGFDVTAEASIAAGGPVTIAGAVLLAIAGTLYALE